MNRLSLLAATLLLGGCAGAQPAGGAAGPGVGQAAPQRMPANSPAGDSDRSASGSETPPWLKLATPADIQRLTDWRDQFAMVRKRVLASESKADMLAGGTLYEVDAAIDYAPPPAGVYDCNVTKLAGRYLEMIAYDYFRCRIIVENGRRQFVKLTGSQRPVGHIHDAPPTGERDKAHGVSLGTLMLGDEAALVPYGAEPERDLAGIVERLGQKRWRILFPKPFYESELDIIDLQRIEQ